MRFPWSKTPEESDRDLEDEIEIDLAERIRAAWARFHEGLPWQRIDEEAGRDHDEPAKPGRWKRWAAIGGGVVVLLAGTIYLLGPKVNQSLEDRSLRKAREYLRVQDYQRAQLTLEQAVQVNPANLEARRELAQFYEEAGSPRAVGAWHELVLLDPSNNSDRLSLAHCALTFGDLATVTEALDGVTPQGRATALYHQLMAAVDLKKNDQTALNAEIAALAKLEPGDARAEFNWAVVRRGSPDPRVRAQAQTELEVLARGDEMRIRATLELIAIGIRENSVIAYSRLADVILKAPRGAFVTALGAPRRGLLDLVEHMEGQPNPSSEDAAVLGEWLVRQGYPADAVLWLGTLKPEVRASRAVMSADAFAFARIHDWPGVEKEVRAGAWGKIPDDVVTLAFAARVQHGQVRLEHAADTWTDAVELAPSAESLRVLLRLSNEFGWPNESIRVLWQLSKVAPGDAANWRSLAATVSALRPTTELLAVYTQWARAMPVDPIPRGQLRWVQTLLGHGPPMDPTPDEIAFPDLSAARALELDETSRAPAALTVLEQVPAGARTDWRVALARGLTFALLSRRGESERELSIASAAPLLAEEKKLLDRARAINSGAGPAR